MVDWKKLIEIVTVIAIVTTMIVNIFAFFGLKDQLEQNKTAVSNLQQLITQNSQLLQNVSKLVELQITQVSLSQEAVNQTQLSKIQDTFLKEGDHSVLVENCIFDNESKSIRYNLVVFTEKQKPTLLSFFVKMYLYYYVEDENRKTVGWGWTPVTSIMLPPSGEHLLLDVPIFSEILEKNNRANVSELYIRSQYNYTLYSDVGNTPLLPPVMDSKGQLLIAFKKDQNGAWQRIIDNNNIICKL